METGYFEQMHRESCVLGIDMFVARCVCEGTKDKRTVDVFACFSTFHYTKSNDDFTFSLDLWSGVHEEENMRVCNHMLTGIIPVLCNFLRLLMAWHLIIYL